MGCGGSKVDDQPLVILCRERKELIKAASYHRSALAVAHLVYFQSLHDVGEAIQRLVDNEIIVNSSSSSPDSPLLTLPSDEGKPKKQQHKGSISSTSISHSIIEEEEDTEGSGSGSHLDLSSGSESESGSEAGSDDDHIQIDDTPEHELNRSTETFPPGYPTGYAPPGYQPGYPYPVGGMYFMKKSAPSSQLFIFQPENHRVELNRPTETFPPDYPTSYAPPGYQPGYPYPVGGMYFMKKSAPPSQPFIFQPENHRVELNRSTETFPPDYPTSYAPPGYQPGYPYPVGGMYFMKKSAPSSQQFIFQPENHRVEPSDSRFGYPPPYPGDYSSGVQRSSPAPPSPPRVSTWDFLNVFDTYDYSKRASSYYPPGMASISSSPDSKEVREREGIPELEEESEHEVIKQVYKRPKRTALKKVKEHRDDHKNNRRGYVGKETLKAVPMPATESSLDSETVSTFSGSDVESDFHYVKSSNSSSGQETIMGTESSGGVGGQLYGNKKGVSFELEEASTSSFDVESSKISSLSSLSIHGTRDLREVVKEIKSEFEVASSCGKEVAMLLEVSKLPYPYKDKGGFKVILSRIMYLVAPSTRSARSKPELSIRLTSRTLQMAKAYNGRDGFTGNLSSTLDKLYVWEKKLYKEVKNEEKLRSIYEDKCKSLKKMDTQGAESIKIDATRAYIRKLLTKLDISVKSIDSISRRIHKLRDEELQPQLTQLIHGLIRMWRSMLKCHQKQFQAIMESKVRSVKVLQKDSGSKPILDLEMELKDWCISFNDWINTQKRYAQTLNGWLSKCLHYEPEATEDGYAPFSPSQIGAPPIFIICKDWQEAMDRISGEKVSNAMQGYASSLHELWEKQEEEEQRLRSELELRDAESDKRSVVSKGRSESGISVLDDLRVDLDSMRKKLVDERGKTVVNKAYSSTLKAGFAPIFDALRKFNVEVVKAHEIVRLQHPQTSS